MPKLLSRRDLLRYAGLAGAASLIAACKPQVVEKIVKETVEVEKVVKETVVVEKEVEKAVKETVVVEKEVEKVVEKTVIVEKVVTAVPAPADAAAEITYWGYAAGIRFVPGKPWGDAKAGDYETWHQESFQDRHPNVKVNVELLEHDDTYFTKINAGLMAGTQPDIVMGPVSEAAMYIVRGLVSPIDEYASEKDMADWSPQVLEEFSFEGKHYLWPWRLSYGGGVYVNGKILEERGVKDLVPQDEERKDWTHDDFLEICKACTFDRNGDGKIDIYGTGLCVNEPYHSVQFQYGWGARMWNEDESAVIINSPEGVASMEWLTDLEWKEKVAFPGSAARMSPDVISLWETGNIAVFGGSGAGGKGAAIEELEEEGVMEFIFCMPPSLPDKEPGVMTNIHGYYVLQSKDINQTWWAHKFCEHLVRPEAISVSVLAGRPPARVSFWGQVGEDPNMKVGVRMVNYMRSFGRRKSSREIIMVMLRQTHSAIYSQQVTPKEGLDSFAAEATKLLQGDIAGE